jgi:hypothetical protein
LLQEPKWFEDFIDTEAPEGKYSIECWEAMGQFLGDDEVVLPSQPYQAALELRNLSLPHLQNLALGELEHMVRLSMGKKKLLTFHGDALKPTRVVRQLELKEKNQRSKVEEDPKMKGAKAAYAAPGKVEAAPTYGAGPIPTGEILDKDDLTVVLLQLMRRFPDGVSLSLMKQHVQSHCSRALNEANFKCSKLADVFKLAPLSAIFPLEQVPHRNEIIVRPPNESAIPNHIWQKYYHLKEHGGLPPHADSGPVRPLH